MRKIRLAFSPSVLVRGWMNSRPVRNRTRYAVTPEFKSPFLNITANPAPSATKPDAKEPEGHAETFESLPRRSYLTYHGSGDLDL